MKMIKVQLKDNSYPIFVGQNVLPQLPRLLRKLAIGQDAIVITNPLVQRLYGKALVSALKKGGFTAKVFEVEDAETSKSIDVAVGLIEKIVRYSVDKKIFIVAFGGGVVGDLAGFVAAILKRGVSFVQVPTTLLAQVDSSIGGKVAVDLPLGKNLVGAFYQPKLVLADVALLQTLSGRQIKNGLAEAVKYGVIADPKLFAFLERNYQKLLDCDARVMTRVVWTCAAIKAGIVSKDEKETKGLRTILNFGHTVGHAIETAGGYDRYNHGEAVALGMRVACGLSCQVKIMKPIEAARVECLLSAIGLPEQIENVSLSKILQSMRFDKKFLGKKNRFVLVQGIGKTIIREGISVDILRKVIARFIKV